MLWVQRSDGLRGCVDVSVLSCTTTGRICADLMNSVLLGIRGGIYESSDLRYHIQNYPQIRL